MAPVLPANRTARLIVIQLMKPDLTSQTHAVTQVLALPLFEGKIHVQRPHKVTRAWNSERQTRKY